MLLDAAGNVVLSDDPDHLVALVGVRDSVVVHTRDVTLVCPVADAERVKDLLAEVTAGTARFPARLPAGHEEFRRRGCGHRGRLRAR